MLVENKYFQGILSKYASKTKDEDVVSQIQIRHKMEGEIQNFLTSYADRCQEINVLGLFNHPVPWKSISIEAAYKFKVQFDALEFDATLTEIKVKRTFKKNIESYQYDLNFEMDQDSEIHNVLPSFLNQKELDENGKKKLVLFDVNLEPLERLMKK